MNSKRLVALIFGGVLVVAITVFAATKVTHSSKQASSQPAAASAPDAGTVAPAPAAPSADGGSAAADPQLIARGKDLYVSQACSTCHTTNGAQSTGPSFLGLYGRTQKLRDGSTVTVDDAYLRESILNSSAKVVDGFLPLMPNYSGRLDDADVDALIAWIKTLK